MSCSNRWARALGAALAAAAVAAAAAPAAAPDDAPMPGDWRVVDGRVDRGTYLGWKIFHSTCFACHGVDATGSAVAPNLLERVPNMTPRDFASKVLTSYRLVSPGDEDSAAGRQATLEEVLRRDRRARRGQVLMPAWGDDAQVPPHVLDLYAYLGARASGELGPGEPKVIASPRAKRPKTPPKTTAR